MYGVDAFRYPIATFCSTIADRVRVANLSSMPYFDDNQFELVFSTEVLEHISTPQVGPTIRELARIGSVNDFNFNFVTHSFSTLGKRFFITIGMEPDSEDKPGAKLKYHETVRDRSWWLAQFEEAGLVIDDDAVQKFMQNKDRLKNATKTASSSSSSSALEQDGFCHECFWRNDPEFPTLFLLRKTNDFAMQALIMGKGPSARRLTHRNDCLAHEHNELRITPSLVTVCSMFVVAINSALHLVDYADLFVANDYENLFERIDAQTIVRRARSVLLPTIVNKRRGDEIVDSRLVLLRLRKLGYRGPVYLYHIVRNFGGKAIIKRRRQLIGDSE